MMQSIKNSEWLLTVTIIVANIIYIISQPTTDILTGLLMNLAIIAFEIRQLYKHVYQNQRDFQLMWINLVLPMIFLVVIFYRFTPM
jgi:hypothetical protein